MKQYIGLFALMALSCAHRIDPASLRLAGRQDIAISQDEILKTPTLVRGTLADLSAVKKSKYHPVLMQFLNENADLFGLQNPKEELRLLRSEDDELGFTHYRYERIIDTVPVYGDELIIHVNKEAHVYQVNGRYHPAVSASSTPVIKSKKAGALALELGAGHQMQKVDQTALVFYPAGKGLSLAWHVILSGGMNKWEYFLDAEDGSVLFDQDRRRF